MTLYSMKNICIIITIDSPLNKYNLPVYYLMELVFETITQLLSKIYSIYLCGKRVSK